MTKLQNLLIVIICSLLSACATLSEEQCLQGDWYQIGQRDGRNGYAADRLDAHRSACEQYQVSADSEAYYEGYDDGLIDYCSPQSGFERAVERQEYRYVCPPQLEQEFLREYTRELSNQVSELDYEYDTVRRQLERARHRARYAETEEKRERAQYRADQYESQINRIDEQRFQLNEWIRRALNRF